MNRRLRVLTIGHSYCVALNRALVREVARDSSFDITVAAPAFFHGDLRPIAVEPEPQGSPLRLVPLKTRNTRFIHVFAYDRDELRDLMRDGAFDVVHAWEEPYIFAGYQIARTLKNSTASFCFRTAQSYVKRYPPPFDYFERTVLSRAQGWIAGASLVYQAMLDRGYLKHNGRILNLAVDLEEFRPIPAAARTPILHELGLTPPVVGFVGRFTQAKGLDVLMNAMEQLETGERWSLLLLGSGEYEQTILQWAARNGWSDRVKLKLAKHSEVPRYLGCMDILVAPSQTMKDWREQFGRMIIEAFASGVPVIGSDSGEIPYVIGEAGKIVNEGDARAWASAIKHLLEGAQTRAKFAKRGLERVQRFSVKAIAEQYRDFYRSLGTQSVVTPRSAGVCSLLARALPSKD